LAIVAAIADAHGGRAEVLTAPGEGATFRVHLPVQVPITSEAYVYNGAETPQPPGGAAMQVVELDDSGTGATA
jgi:two-component system OmpR family sensor kinase